MKSRGAEEVEVEELEQSRIRGEGAEEDEHRKSIGGGAGAAA